MKKVEVQASGPAALESMTLLAKDSPKDWCLYSTLKGYREQCIQNNRAGRMQLCMPAFLALRPCC